MLDDSSRISAQIRETLMEFGVSPAVAHEASMRYSNVETAANWAYGDGSNVCITATRVDTSGNPSRMHQRTHSTRASWGEVRRDRSLF